MKKILVCLVSLALFARVDNHVIGQYNLSSGCLTCTDSIWSFQENKLVNPYTNLFQLDEIQCNSNTFYALVNGAIEELQINGTTVTNNGAVVPTGAGYHLAYLDNLNDAALSPTFYSGYSGNLSYFDGTGWIETNCPSNGISGIGGNNSFLYLANSTSILQYDGISVSTLYSFSGEILKIADVAVDAEGNVWCVTGPSTGTFSNSIRVISPSGQIVNQFYFSINTWNAYGCFLLNGIFYIGFGSASPVYPNTILPISFTLNNASIGTPLAMGTQYSYDLASCDPGIPLSLIEHEQKNDNILFPVPAQNELHFSLSSTTVNYYIIYQQDGKMLTPKMPLFGSTSIDISSFQDGAYIIELFTEKGVVRSKFIKH